MPLNVAYISIPRGLPTKLAASSRELKAVCILYQLKSLYVGGLIRDFSRNAKAIAHTFGYSERKLRQYVALLTQRGYIRKQGRHNIILAGKARLAKDFGASKYSYRISVDKLYRLELEMQALAISEGLARQQYRIKQKLQSEYLAQNGKTRSTHLQPAALRRALKGFDVAKQQAQSQARFTAQVQRLQTPAKGHNPFATYSRQGLAKCFGRLSKSTGLRRAKKLVQAGLLSEQPHHICIMACTHEQFRALKRGGLHDAPSYTFQRGWLVKGMPHQLTVTQELSFR